MASRNYIEDKYRCNHPESDFVSNSKGPIEIIGEKNFVEYTRRNETSNYQYDVWNRPSSSAITSEYGVDSYQNATRTTTNRYSTVRNPYNKTTKKKNNSSVLWIILFIYFGLPIIFSIFGAILDAMI